jgi:indolepyruvate ferredoxin oxidoreductase beta subunit
MIVGVGGQGTLLASRVLGRVMLDAGYDVKVSEVHGMSQRGGSVVPYVRWGDKVESPVINEGEASVLLAFEQSVLRHQRRPRRKRLAASPASDTGSTADKH